MDSLSNPTAEPAEEPKPTAPENFTIQLRGFASEDKARQFGELLGGYVRVLSREIDMATLDGVTVAFDFGQALLDLDRGYQTSHQLTPSDEFAVGVAMTPSVMRNGILKSHVVLHAGVALGLDLPEGDDFGAALHTLAHECAHVEVTAKFDQAFPGFLLRHAHANMHDAFRWEVIFACWDEYAVTNIAALFGADPTAGYEQTFLRVLSETREKANAQIRAYRLHRDVDRILGEVYGTYGDLMKFACYQLGNLAGRGMTLEELPDSQAAIESHWFRPYCERLCKACEALADDYGRWTDRLAFEAIGDILDEIVQEGGVVVSPLEDGRLYVDIPYTWETMPIGVSR